MALGYDGSGQVPASLLAGRLDTYQQQEFNPKEHALSGVISQAVRFRQNGGNRQQDRMIKNKRRSLDRAVWHSYQAAEIARVGSDNVIKALINPNRVKQDYDDKILSVGFEHEFKCGDVFEWIGTNSHWLIYLQDLTELAYFRGDIRRCSYVISWEVNGKRIETYVALTGPSERKIQSVNSHGLSFDTPNYMLNLLVPYNEDTVEYFTRYNKFYLQGDETCWRIEAVDRYSTPGILQVSAVENYANAMEDNIAEGVVGGLIEKPKNPNNAEADATILGETFIKVKKQYTYTFRGRMAAEWRVDEKYPVILIPGADPHAITLMWDSAFSGQFELSYGKYTKTIVVESLF